MGTNAPISPLVADLMTSMLTDTQRTTERVIDNLTTNLATEKARVAAIRVAVLYLLDGPWMPNPEAIRRALYPSAELVASCREGD
jgi:hypothetical protein